MSYQVGFACYADAGAAGAASCSSFGTQINTLSTGQIQSLSCASADPSTGAMNMQTSTAQPGGVASVSFTTIQPIFQPCMYGDWIDAGLQIAVAVLTVWTMVFMYKKIAGILNWSRGDE